MDLVDILTRPEGKSLEFKRDLSSPDGVLKTLIAFANTAGGTLLVGVEDRSRNVRGVPDALDVEERIANIVSDSISPRLLPEIEILPWRRTQVLAIQIHPSAARPHYLKREGAESGTYLRVGSTNRRADAEMLQELRRSARGETYDEQPMVDLDSEALDFRALPRLSSPSGYSGSATSRPCGSSPRIRAASSRRLGGLLFGRDREHHFPDAWIQAGRFDGLDKSQILDQAEFRGLPVAAIDAAIAFIEKHALYGAEIGRVRRKDRWNLPPVAVREAVINAVAHADYAQRGAPIRIAIFDDRLEIENPGLLPFGLTVPDLEHGISKLRNRVIGRVFHALGLIEQWGSGIQRITAACREAGLPDPRLEEIATRFRATIFTTQINRPELDDIDQAIVDGLSDGEGKLTSELAAVIGLTSRATRTRLARLVGNGLVREVGSGPQDPKRRYFLTK